MCKLAMTGEEKVSRRQDSKPIFDMTTVCYVADPAYIERSSGILDGHVRAVHIPKDRSIDIDTVLDFEFAQFILERRGGKDDRP